MSLYGLSSVFPVATAAKASTASSSSSLVGHQAMLAQPDLQPSPQGTGYFPSLRLQQHAFPQPMALARLHPLQQIAVAAATAAAATTDFTLFAGSLADLAGEACFGPTTTEPPDRGR